MTISVKEESWDLCGFELWSLRQFWSLTCCENDS